MSSKTDIGHISSLEQETDPRAFADHPVNKKLKKADKISLLREMYRIRRFEERSLRAYQQGRIGGFLHLYIGQEAVAVGSTTVLGNNDHIITAYRDHGHALACGMGMNECMAELYGKATGCSKGKGGSMHFFAPDKRYWGGHGIVAGQTPLGAGLAFALKYKGLKGAALCFMGDGATNQGIFYESLNLASLWDLPVVFIIENNGYSMGTSLERHSAASEKLAKRAEVFNMDWDVGHGNSVLAVRAKVADALEIAHKKSRPSLLELYTYRYRGHSIADANAEKYRSKKEIQSYQENKDPISVYQKILLEDKILTEDETRKINKEAKEEADASAKFAEESDFPSFDDITRDVYWTVDNPGEHDNVGRIFFNDRNGAEPDLQDR